MSECINKKFERMLAEYELDLLSAEDKEAFELHMLECEACYESASQFAQESVHLLRSEKLRSVVEKAMAEFGDSASEGARKTPKRDRLTRAIVYSVSIAAVVMLLFLVLKPWRVQIRSTHEALAGEKRLAVLPFSNRVDARDSNLVGKSATRLLITDLTDSRTVAIVSSKQVDEILRAIGLAGEAEVEENLSLAVADRSNARWIVYGEVTQEEPQVAVNILLLDVALGDTLTHRQLVCLSEQDIFCVVDSITDAIRQQLSPIMDSVGLDRPVADITTYSSDAYRHYVSGVDLYERFLFDQAALSFKDALSYDSTFAMAWYYLAMVEDRELIDSALAHISRASLRDQYWIRGRAALWKDDTTEYVSQLHSLLRDYPDEDEAYYWLAILEDGRGDVNAASDLFRQGLAVNPHNKRIYNQLAYLYSASGNYEQAIWAANKYVELVPKEPNPYDSRGDIYSDFGRVELAIESYREAVGIDPEFANTAVKLANLLLLSGQFEEAERWLGGRATPIQNIPAPDCAVILTSMLISQGLLDSAVHYADSRLNEIWTDYDGPDSLEIAQLLMVQKALVLAETDPHKASKEFSDACQPKGNAVPFPRVSVFHHELRLLAESGRTEEVETALEELGSQCEDHPDKQLLFQFASACIALENGAADSAASVFEALTSTAQYKDDFLIGYLLSRSYVEAGRMEEAVGLVDSLIRFPMLGRVLLPTLNVRLHYYLGVAYEGSNWPEKARDQYEIFLEYWGNTDKELPIVNETRRRLARL